MHTLIYALGALVLISVAIPLVVFSVGALIVALPYLVAAGLVFADFTWNHGALTVWIIMLTAVYCVATIVQNWHKSRREEKRQERDQHAL
jgi:hypothetical protein